MSLNDPVSRRKFLKSSALLLGAAAVALVSCGTAAAAIAKPQLEQGLQIGDVVADGAVVWSRSDRPARLIVEHDVSPSFKDAIHVRGLFALETTDYTARLDLTDLPGDSEIHVRVMFQDLSNDRTLSDPIFCHFRTAPTKSRSIRFLWSGDTAGQGWGINAEFGGMKIYEAMRQTHPDFFIHCGDNIYTDGPIQEFVTVENGKVWHNIVTPEVSKVAETLVEFRGRYKYNLLDENVRRFNAEVPQIWQWDDHEVVNNWSDWKGLTGDGRYTEKNVPLLIARGSRAFLEYAPMRYFSVEESERVYRQIPYGRLLDVFVLDMRSYRAGNSFNRQTEPGPDTAFLGEEQITWLKTQLRESKAVWKVIAADMPLGLQVGDGLDSAGALGECRQRRRTCIGPGVRDRGYFELHQTESDRQRRLDHCRGALLRGALLRSAKSSV
jgi:alkaline phosphatase D